MEWDKIWAINRKVIDPIAPRYTALQKNERVMVNISGISEQCQEAVLNPKVIRGCSTFSLFCTCHKFIVEKVQLSRETLNQSLSTLGLNQMSIQP